MGMLIGMRGDAEGECVGMQEWGASLLPLHTFMRHEVCVGSQSIPALCFSWHPPLPPRCVRVLALGWGIPGLISSALTPTPEWAKLLAPPAQK